MRRLHSIIFAPTAFDIISSKLLIAQRDATFKVKSCRNLNPTKLVKLERVKFHTWLHSCWVWAPCNWGFPKLFITPGSWRTYVTAEAKGVKSKSQHFHKMTFNGSFSFIFLHVLSFTIMMLQYLAYWNIFLVYTYWFAFCCLPFLASSNNVCPSRTVSRSDRENQEISSNFLILHAFNESSTQKKVQMGVVAAANRIWFSL